MTLAPSVFASFISGLDVCKKQSLVTPVTLGAHVVCVCVCACVYVYIFLNQSVRK